MSDIKVGITKLAQAGWTAIKECLIDRFDKNVYISGVNVNKIAGFVYIQPNSVMWSVTV